MIEYIVSLDIEASLSVTGLQISRLLGVRESAISSQQGKKRNLWRYEPVFRDNVKLLTRIERIASDLHIKEPIRKGRTIKLIYLNIGVFYDHNDQYCVAGLSYRSLALLASRIPDLEIFISTYPVDFELGKTRKGKTKGVKRGSGLHT